MSRCEHVNLDALKNSNIVTRCKLQWKVKVGDSLFCLRHGEIYLKNQSSQSLDFVRIWLGFKQDDLLTTEKVLRLCGAKDSRGNPKVTKSLA